MPVLDYPRYLVTAEHPYRGLLTIPAFHTGPVGFIPGHFVYAHLSRKPKDHASEFDARCELLLTPFLHNIGEMFQIKVTLVDRPGVVQKLLDALAHMGVNVNRQESCAVFSGLKGTTHYVEVVGDWTRTSDLGDVVPARPSDRWVYRSLAHRIPIDDGRYLRLLEQIVATCGDIIMFDRAEGPSLPSISMSPFSFRSAGESNEPREVLRSDGTGRGETRHGSDGRPTHRGRRTYDVTVRLSDAEMATIRERCNVDPGLPVRYLLSSDAETRTLRALFIAKGRSLTHVGFNHRDVRGALAEMGALIDEADFNILQSLQRVHSKETSVWELLLEDARTTSAPRPVRGDEPVCGFAANLLTALRALLVALGAPEDDAHAPENLLGGAWDRVEANLDLVEERLDAVARCVLSREARGLDSLWAQQAAVDLGEVVGTIRKVAPPTFDLDATPKREARLALARAKAALSAVRLSLLKATLERVVSSRPRPSAEVALLKTLTIKVCYPAYPLLRGEFSLTPKEGFKGLLDVERVTSEPDVAPDPDAPHRYRRTIDPHVLDEMEDLAAKKRQEGDPTRALLLDVVRSRLVHERPVVFLSYPGRASTLVGHFIGAIEDREIFAVAQYQQPDNNVIIEQAVELIRECDFFVGLWYHDGLEGGEGSESLSQWMPFEYGVARALAKPSLIFQSNRIPPAIRRRLNGGVATKHFDPETFVAKEMYEFVQDIAEEWDRYNSSD